MYLKAESRAPHHLARAGAVTFTCLSVLASIQLANAADPRACTSTYQIEKGETLWSIAHRCGITVGAIREANSNITDVRQVPAGTRIKLPFDNIQPTARIAPAQGRPGQTVLVSVSGFAPDETVKIQAGPVESGWKFVDDLRANEQGDASLHTRIPDWAKPGDKVVFTATTGTAPQARTNPFAVNPEAPEDTSDSAINVRGEVQAGVECPILTTDDGKVYSLNAGSGVDIHRDIHARVHGKRADISFCQQGTPVTVTRFEPIQRPQPSPLSRPAVLGAWVAKGGDCRKPDFDITGNSAGGQVVETSLDGAPRTGYVRLGPDPAFIFDQPTRVMPLSPRRAESLAVLPPQEGPANLGGNEISGDGVVFVKCSDEFAND